jgi:NAD(P)-dependent dehydrogenase (short-subunit alcohol dehydrogenase family)
MGRVEGKIAIVTGGATGIGAATAHLLAEHGATVVIADIERDGAESRAEELHSKGFQAIGFEFDLGDESSVAALIERTCSTFGGLDILHNNAAATHLASNEDSGISGARAWVWDDTFRINVRGTAIATKLAAEQMIRRSGGSIINTSSVAGLRGDIGHAAYGASKAAINAITLYAAAEYGKQGVRVNAVAPGLILTETAQASGHANRLLPMMESHHLTARAGLPSDVAAMVLYLASDESAFVTGSIFRIDGGIMSAAPYVADLRGMLVD